MNTASHTHTQNPGWQTLGEIKLPVSVHMGEAIVKWLEEILAPLNLSIKFMEGFSQFARTLVARAGGVSTTTPLNHIHISILVPDKHGSNGKSWGFFHIERIENQTDNIHSKDHAIDIYLYVEGE